MKSLLHLVLAFLLAGNLTAQTTEIKVEPLKKTVLCKMPLTADDDMPGTRGASIVWNPLQKKYFASMAGNAGYPFAVFDAIGKRISADDLKCEFDVRGLWFNPAKKRVEGNGYNETGWFFYKTDAKGTVTGADTIRTGMVQPGEQSVGTFNPKTNEVLFLYGSLVTRYKYATGEYDESTFFPIHFGRTKKDGASEDEDLTETPEAYNATTLVYTGKAGAEIGFLNVELNRVELYDIKSGFMTQAFALPDGVTAQPSFNFSYTNDMFWFFDMDSRTWIGCKQ
jgi:hypothetical protein